MANFGTGRNIPRGAIQPPKAIAPLRQKTPLQRGRIEDADDGLDGIEFGFMPEITGGYSANYSAISVRGLSHNIYQYHSGKGEDFTLKIVSDDRDPRPCPQSDNDQDAFTKPEYDYNWLKSKSVATQRNNQVQGIPPVLILTWGVEAKFVRIDNVTYRDIKLYPNGRPRRREITVKLFYVIDSHRNPDDILVGL